MCQGPQKDSQPQPQAITPEAGRPPQTVSWDWPLQPLCCARVRFGRLLAGLGQNPSERHANGLAEAVAVSQIVCQCWGLFSARFNLRVQMLLLVFRPEILGHI